MIKWSGAAHAPIGFFDSGVGGLTVLKATKALLPYENFIYFADVKNLPYGDKALSKIREYALECLKTLRSYAPKCIVVSCYTACVALEDMEEYHGIPVILLWSALAKAVCAVQEEKNRIGIWGTPVMILKNVHEKYIWEKGFTGTLYNIACPQLASLVQEGDMKSPELSLAVEKYLEDFTRKNLDILVYGCTHYPIIDALVAEKNSSIHRVDPSSFLAQEVHELLEKKDLLNPSKNSGNVEWTCSGDALVFLSQLRKACETLSSTLDIVPDQDVMRDVSSRG